MGSGTQIPSFLWADTGTICEVAHGQGQPGSAPRRLWWGAVQCPPMVPGHIPPVHFTWPYTSCLARGTISEVHEVGQPCHSLGKKRNNSASVMQRRGTKNKVGSQVCAIIMYDYFKEAQHCRKDLPELCRPPSIVQSLRELLIIFKKLTRMCLPVSPTCVPPLFLNKASQ